MYTAQVIGKVWTTDVFGENVFKFSVKFQVINDGVDKRIFLILFERVIIWKGPNHCHISIKMTDEFTKLRIEHGEIIILNFWVNFGRDAENEAHHEVI